ncbi:TRAP transporter small permease [candidate division KSB1 bacterium]
MNYLKWFEEKLSKIKNFLLAVLLTLFHTLLKYLKWFDEKISKAENFLLVVLLTLMVGLAFLLVILRQFFNTGITGGEEFLRHLVLLVAFLGAAQAVRVNKHIKIDVLAKLLSVKFKNIAAIFINLFALVVTFLLAKAAWIFLLSEIEFGGASDIFGIKPWVFEIIIPLGFFLISYRFFLHFIDALVLAFRREK